METKQSLERDHKNYYAITREMDGKMKRWKRDVIYSIVLIVFCAVMWVTANGFEQKLVKIELAKPTAYAHLWIGLLGILAVIQLIRALVKRPDEEMPRIFTPLMMITIGILVFYVVTIRQLGFFLNTFLLLAVLLISYSAAMGKITWKEKKKAAIQILFYLAVSLIITIAVQYIFTELLGANLPDGVLFR